MSDLLLFIFLGITPLIYAVYFLFGPRRIKWPSVFIASIAIGLLLLFVSTALLKPLVLNPLPPDASAEQRVVRIITEERVRSANATSKPLGFTLSVFACMVWNLACYWLCFLTSRFVFRSKQLPNQAGPVSATKVMSGVALSMLPLAFVVAFAANSIAKMQRPQVVIASAPDKGETAPTNTSPESPQIESKAPPTSVEPNRAPQLEPAQQTRTVAQPPSDSTKQQPPSPSVATDTKSTPLQLPASTPVASQLGEPIELPSLRLRAVTDLAKIFALRTQGLTHNAFNNTNGRGALHKFLDAANRPGSLGDYFLSQIPRDEREKLKPSFADGDSKGWTRGHSVHCELVSKSCTFLVYIPDYADLDRTMKKRIRQGFWSAAYAAANQEMPPETDLLVAIFHNEDGELTTNEILFGKLTRSAPQDRSQVWRTLPLGTSSESELPVYKRGTSDELLARISSTPIEELPTLPQQIAKSDASKTAAPDQADNSSLFAEDSAIAKQFRSYNELKHNSFNNHPASLVLGLFEHSLINSEAMSFIELEHAKYISKHNISAAEVKPWRDQHAIHCQLSEKSCVFLIDIPPFYQFEDEGKERIRYLTWTAANECLQGQLPAGSEIAVAIFGRQDDLVTVNSQEIMLGKVVPIEQANNDPELLRRYFQGRLPTGVSNGQPDDLLKYFDLVPAAQAALQSQARGGSNDSATQKRTNSSPRVPGQSSEEIPEIAQLFYSNTRSFSSDSSNGVFARGALDTFIAITNSAEGAGALIMKASDPFRTAPKPKRGQYNVFAEWDENPVLCELKANSCAFLIFIPYYNQFDVPTRREISRDLWVAAVQAARNGIQAGAELKPGADIAVAIFHHEDNRLRTMEIMVGKIDVPKAGGFGMRVPRYKQRNSLGASVADSRRGSREDLLKFFDIKPSAKSKETAQQPQVPDDPPRRKLNVPTPEEPEATSEPTSLPQPEPKVERQQPTTAPVEPPPPAVQVVEPEITQTFRKLNQLEHNSSNNQKAQSILDTFESRINQPDGPVERVMLEYFRYRSEKGDEAADKFKSWKQNHAIHCQLNADSCAFLIDVPLFASFYPESQSKLRHEFWHAANDSLQGHLPNGSRLSVAIFHTESDKVITNDVLLGSVTLPFESNTEEPEPTARRYKTFAPKDVTQGKPEDLPPFFK